MEVTEIKIRKIVTAVTGLPTDVSADANLYLDLGVASVCALQLLSELELQFQTSIPDDDFVESTTISSLISMMRHLTQEIADESTHA